VVSAHFCSTYSANGKNWTWTPQPYTHTVDYDDGTSRTYTTLERSNLHFDAAGQLTHLNLNLAADQVTGDEWDDHAGTINIALDA